MHHCLAIAVFAIAFGVVTYITIVMFAVVSVLACAFGEWMWQRDLTPRGECR